MSESSKCDDGHSDEKCCQCHTAAANPSVYQNLDELEFERSIFQAAIDNNVQKINKFAKSHDFDVNAMDNYGYTALHYAARNGNLNAAKTLIKLGAKVNLPTRSLKATALHRAVTANKVEMVTYLLSIGADRNLKDNDGLTPKERAVKENREQIIQIL